MTATAYRGLQQILNPLVGFLEEEKLAKAWAARDQNAIKRVDKLLASAGLTMDAVMAQTLSISLDDIERIDRMIATAEVRRNERKPPREHSGQDKRQRECARKHGPCRAHNCRHRGTNISALMIRPKMHSLTCAPDTSPA